MGELDMEESAGLGEDAAGGGGSTAVAGRGDLGREGGRGEEGERRRPEVRELVRRDATEFVQSYSQSSGELRPFDHSRQSLASLPHPPLPSLSCLFSPSSLSSLSFLSSFFLRHPLHCHSLSSSSTQKDS